MSVEKIGHDFDFELANMCSLFFPGEKLAQNDSPFHIRSIVGKDQHGPYAVCEIIWEGRRYDGRFDAPTASKRDLEYAVCKSFYQAAVKLTGHHPKWGILTGIRPAKLARQLLEQGLSEEQVIARFQQEYFASPAAAKLCLETDKRVRR